jgi:hypothetical protein
MSDLCLTVTLYVFFTMNTRQNDTFSLHSVTATAAMWINNPYSSRNTRALKSWIQSTQDITVTMLIQIFWGVTLWVSNCGHFKTSQSLHTPLEMTLLYIHKYINIKPKLLTSFHDKPFRLKSRCCRFIRDAIAGGRLWTSLSLIDKTLNPWQWKRGRGKSRICKVKAVTVQQCYT